MKKKIRELFYSFLALFLFSCVFAAAVFLSILLIPVLIVTIGVIAIKEMIVWRRKNKKVKGNSVVIVEHRETAVVRTMPDNRPFRKVA